MRLSRQSLLGLVMLVGGIIMLFAMIKQVNKPDLPEEQTVELTPVDSPDAAQAQSLDTLTTTDLDRESQLLAQKQQEREAIIAKQEVRAAELLRQQEVAEARALEKARLENEEFRSAAEPINDIETEVTRPTVNTREDVATATAPVTQASAAPKLEEAKVAEVKPEVKKPTTIKQETTVTQQKSELDTKLAAPKRAGEYIVQKGESLTVIANAYNVPVDALAQANKLTSESGLQLGQTLKIPSASQIKRLQADAAYLESKRQAEAKAKQAAEQRKAEQKAALERKSTQARQTAQQNLNAARQQVKETDAKGTFGVQVALASNQEKADEIAGKFKAAGYPVNTSQTDKGVRVLVGPERGKIAAVALKDKINSDPRVDTTSAWVLYWR